jgi:DNA-binding XRE family transcriptional regulator
MQRICKHCAKGNDMTDKMEDGARKAGSGYRAKTLNEVIAALPQDEQQEIAERSQALISLQRLRLAAEQTQAELAQTLGVRQDTISRLEKRSDMLLSTLRRYIEGMGGTLELVAKFPGRPPLVIEHLGVSA